MLKREVYLHLNAVSQVLKDLERRVELRQAVNESDVLVVCPAPFDPEVVHEFKMLKASLGFSVALADILLKEIDVR